MTPLILAAGILALIGMLAVGLGGLRSRPAGEEAAPVPAAPATSEARQLCFPDVPVSRLRRAA